LPKRERGWGKVARGTTVGISIEGFEEKETTQKEGQRSSMNFPEKRKRKSGKRGSGE